jgi:hypothetical protein
MEDSTMPVFERIEPGPKYDATTGRFLGRAYAKPGDWVYTTVPRPTPGARTAAWLASHGILLDLVDAGGLTTYERAFERSLWYVHNGGAGGVRNPVWSLQRQWGPVTPRGRMLGIRVQPVAAGQAAWRRMPRDRKWTANGRLQSGGAGSPKQRFG